MSERHGHIFKETRITMHRAKDAGLLDVGVDKISELYKQYRSNIPPEIMTETRIQRGNSACIGITNHPIAIRYLKALIDYVSEIPKGWLSSSAVYDQYMKDTPGVISYNTLFTQNNPRFKRSDLGIPEEIHRFLDKSTSYGTAPHILNPHPLSIKALREFMTQHASKGLSFRISKADLEVIREESHLEPTFPKLTVKESEILREYLRPKMPAPLSASDLEKIKRSSIPMVPILTKEQIEQLKREDLSVLDLEHQEDHYPQCILFSGWQTYKEFIGQGKDR